MRTGVLANAAAHGIARQDKVTTNDLQVELITSLADLDGMGDVWRTLYLDSDATPYSCFEWIRSYVATVEEPGGFCVCLVRDAGEPIAILPFMRKRRAFSTHLTILAGGQSPGNTMVLTERARGRDVLRTALARVRSVLGRWDYCQLETVAVGSRLMAELRTAAAEDHDQIESVPAGTNVRIELPDSWESYASGLSKSHRQNLSRRLRGLERRGKVEYVRFGPGDPYQPEPLASKLEDAIRICRDSWQGSSTEGTAMCHDGQVGFFRAVTQAAAAVGALDFSVLYLDGAPVSYLWGLARAPVSNITALGFVPGLGAVSPGLGHLGLHIRHSIERGLKAIDFGHKYEDYKRRWSKAGDGVEDVLWFARPVGRFRKRLQDRWSGSVVYRLRRLRRWAASRTVAKPT